MDRESEPASTIAAPAGEVACSDVAHALAFERGKHPQDDLVLHGATIAHRCDGQA
jgi:hypothetical protein